MRLGVEPKGLIASGTVIASPYEDGPWDHEKLAQGQVALYVKIALDHLVDGPPPIPLFELEEIAPDFTWTPQASGNRIPSDVAQEIERRWAQRTHLGCATLVKAAHQEVTIEGWAKRELHAGRAGSSGGHRIPDPIVEEVRAIRDEIAKEHDDDINAIFETLQRLDATSAALHVSLPPRAVIEPGSHDPSAGGEAA